MEMNPPHSNAHHEHHSSKMKWLLAGTALAAGAIIVAPYVLPLVGIGTGAQAVDAMTAIHSAAGGSGLAGLINNAMGAIPLIGETLAEGGVKTAIASGIFGLGGMLLNRYTDKHDDGKRHIKWGKVIGTAALITSALIALPTVLTGISAGIVFLSSFAGTSVAQSTISAMTSTLGAANAKNLAVTGASAAALALPHLLTCGVAAVPAVVSLTMNSKKRPETAVAVAPQKADMNAALPGKVTATVALGAPTEAGKEVLGCVTLTDANGKPITPADLKTIHTKKLHFFVIDSSMRDYHHIHPTPTDVPGQYAFSFTPKTNNSYSGWADVTLLQDNKNYRLKTEMPAAMRRSMPASIMVNSRAEAKNAGLSFEWNADKPLTKNASSMVEVTVKDANGRPVTDLEPVLGAYAHLVGFAADGKSMIHTHPMGQEPVDASSRSGPTLRFHIKPEDCGNTQFYLQVKEHGQDVYAPFGQIIKQPEKATEQVQPRSLYPNAMPASHLGMA